MRQRTVRLRTKSSDAKASPKLVLNAPKNSETAHKTVGCTEQCIRTEIRIRMAKVLPSLHDKIPADKDWKEIVLGAFGQEARNMTRGMGE